MYRTDMYGMLPGFSGVSETYDRVFQWGRIEDALIVGAVLSGAARDAGNGNQPGLMRPGLLLGKVTSSGKLKEYNPTGTDGSDLVYGVLCSTARTVNFDNADQDRLVRVLVRGPVKASGLIGLDAQARSQMRGRFLFDDDHVNPSGLKPHLRVQAKTSNYTVLAADAGTLFTTTGASGAVTFTLPAIAAGLGPFEFLNTVDQNMTVASAEGDNIVTLNDNAADSLAFSTSSQKVGGHLRVYADNAGTKWLVEVLSGGTLTIAT